MELATPPSELQQRLTALGWQVDKIDFQGGKYVASGKNAQTGQSVEREGASPEMALAAVYQHATRANAVRRPLVAAWQRNWYDQLHDIAKAYADLPPYSQNAVENWQTLAVENSVHAALIQQALKVEMTPEWQPYESPHDMIEDVHQKQRLLVSTAESHNHPLFNPQQVIELRICHDVLGICQSGGGWSWPGANKAATNHLPHLSELARPALFVEIIGRVAYETVYRGLGGSKVGLLPKFYDPVAKLEGEHLSPWRSASSQT